MTSSLNTYLVAYMYVLHSNLCFLGTGLISDVSKLKEYKLLKVTSYNNVTFAPNIHKSFIITTMI